MARRRRNSDQDTPPGYDALLAELKPLVAQIAALQEQMKATGIFADDRELLECPHCCLQEDVLIDGRLVTCERETPGKDTGLRFAPLDKRESWWRCPRCGAEFAGEGFDA